MYVMREYHESPLLLLNCCCCCYYCRTTVTVLAENNTGAASNTAPAKHLATCTSCCILSTLSALQVPAALAGPRICLFSCSCNVTTSAAITAQLTQTQTCCLYAAASLELVAKGLWCCIRHFSRRCSCGLKASGSLKTCIQQHNSEPLSVEHEPPLHPRTVATMLQ